MAEIETKKVYFLSDYLPTNLGRKRIEKLNPILVIVDMEITFSKLILDFSFSKYYDRYGGVSSGGILWIKTNIYFKRKLEL